MTAMMVIRAAKGPKLSTGKSRPAARLASPKPWAATRGTVTMEGPESPESKPIGTICLGDRKVCTLVIKYPGKVKCASRIPSTIRKAPTGTRLPTPIATAQGTPHDLIDCRRRPPPSGATAIKVGLALTVAVPMADVDR